MLDPDPRHSTCHCRGFTLLESLLASSILLIVVIAVSSALSAAHQHAYEARQRVTGNLAAEELLNRLLTVEYAALPAWHGYTEPAGAMTDVTGNSFPDSYNAVGREVTVVGSIRLLTDVDVYVQGRTVTVRTFDDANRTLAEISRFVPEPQS